MINYSSPGGGGACDLFENRRHKTTRMVVDEGRSLYRNVRQARPEDRLNLKVTPKFGKGLTGD